jgi:hypothetical protein
MADHEESSPEWEPALANAGFDAARHSVAGRGSALLPRRRRCQAGAAHRSEALPGTSAVLCGTSTTTERCRAPGCGHRCPCGDRASALADAAG